MPTHTEGPPDIPVPQRADSVPYGAHAVGRGMAPPPRSATSQSHRAPPLGMYQPQQGPPPPQGGYGYDDYDQGYYDGGYYDEYYNGGGANGYPPQNLPPPEPDLPNFDDAPAGRNSLDLSMRPTGPPEPQRGPQRIPELNKSKSQPDLRAPQQAVFEMAPDAPPMPSMGSQAQYDQLPNRSSPPVGGLPSNPRTPPVRPGHQPTPPNVDGLPSHPAPIRPGHVQGTLANKPPPVRNYGGIAAPARTTTPAPAPVPVSVPVQNGPVRPGPEKPQEPPVTLEELEQLRSMVKADSQDQRTAFRLAKRLMEAADVLVPNIPDPKARHKGRERYQLDAQKILKKLSNAQNPEAMFTLADAIGKGMFGESDNKESFTLYQSAAKLGHAAAAYRTAVCCEIGNEEGGGTRKDPLKAMQWYKRACLSPDTLVRTTTGNKATRDLQVADMLLDDEDRPVQCLTAGPIQTSSNMKTIRYEEYGSSKKVSFDCTSDHVMTMRITSVKPFLAAQSRVFWYTRCDRSEARDEANDIKWDQVMHELFAELSEDLGRRPTDGEVRRYIQVITDTRVFPDSEDEDEDIRMDDKPVSPVMVEVLHELEKLGVDVNDELPAIGLKMLEYMDEYLESLMPEEEAIPDDDDDLVFDIDAPAPRPFAALSRLASSVHQSDPSYRTGSQARGSSPMVPGDSQGAQDSQGTNTSFADTTQLVPEDDLMEKFAAVREQLNNPRKSAHCKNPACKGIRKASARFKNDEQAQLAVKLLSGDHYRVIDPYVVREYDLFTMTLEEYQATCHYKEKPANRRMRLYRAPLAYVPSNAPSTIVPIDPYWLGFYLGDGNKYKAAVHSSDPEIKVYCQKYVDRLNREGAAGLTGLHLAEETATEADSWGKVRDGKPFRANVTTLTLTISLNKQGYENPIIRSLKDLGLWQDKSAGIPDCYMNADEDTRLAVLAGLIESDGTLSHLTNVYCFSQYTLEHEKIARDARELALSCGIQCTPVSNTRAATGSPGWRFWMSKGTEKFQHHLLIPRKRLDLSKIIKRADRDIRGFDVEDAGDGEYRLIEVSGGLYQLADRTVVHNCTLGDTPAMYKVGMILLKGLLGQQRNPREAISWLKRAAEVADTENPHALHELGLLYESAGPNDVILRDPAYAFQLFKQAAELGYKFSQFRLGCAYEYGLMGCPIEPRLSIMWYSKAAEQGEHQSELALSGWYLTGSDNVLGQNDTEAYLWARKAAMAGLAKAEYAMGYFTEMGIGVPANLEDAKRWYWRAACKSITRGAGRTI